MNQMTNYESNPQEKIFLRPGDCVRLRQHNLMHSPVMLVLRKETALFKDSQSLKGIRCRWITADDQLQEAVFYTKDLIKVE